jgi:dGTPase
LKNLTSDVIGVFCGSVQHATRDVHGTGPLVRHAADLVVPRETAAEIGVLKGIAARFVMEAPGRVEVMDRQRALLHELFAALEKGGPDLLDPQFRLDHEAAIDDAARTRVLVDQIASLTDGSAVAWHGRLVRTSRGAGA